MRRRAGALRIARVAQWLTTPLAAVILPTDSLLYRRRTGGVTATPARETAPRLQAQFGSCAVKVAGKVGSVKPRAMPLC